MHFSWIPKTLSLILLLHGSKSSCVPSINEAPENQKELGTNWAVLVAGSSGWEDYRHQADICHAYQILHANGIPDSNIVVMMYDDIANHYLNPMKGVIINKANSTTNVYVGVPKDYTGVDVTPENFLNVLQGNEAAMEGIGSGKVIKSGPNDRIFLNLADHGGTGLFCFPSTFLLGKTLVANIVDMYRNNKFKEMVIYVESCESGSLFENLLPNDVKVFAVTASNQSESSYACSFDSLLNVFVGDLFSVLWMEDIENEGTKTETFEQQFEIVKNETVGVETPCRYGDISVEYETLDNFLGSKKPEARHRNRNKKDDIYNKELRKASAVKSPDVPFHILENKLRNANSDEEKEDILKKIIQLHKNRKFISNKVEEIVLRITKEYDLMKKYTQYDERTQILDWGCYELAVKYFHEECFNLGKNSFALRMVGTFAKLCNHGYSEIEIRESILKVCDHPTVHNVI